MTLRELKIGRSAQVQSITGAGIFAARLLDMGFIPGSRVTLRACAPCGDPLLIEIRKAAVILRKEEAACIHIAEEQTR